jgi:hypothetical protein
VVILPHPRQTSITATIVHHLDDLLRRRVAKVGTVRVPSQYHHHKWQWSTRTLAR